uniref:HMA domain-containing protein n=1 Tax=Populus trichocarpa TaxID=3694 RepID=A0A2K2AW86_POPTR
MGALDHLSGFFDCSSGSSKLKKRRQLQTVEVKVRIDCEGCERKVKRALEGMKGVKQVDVERKANKVTVVGYVDPSKVVARVAHRTGKKAPAGYVRNAEDPQVSQLARASSTEVRYTTAFSDENPAACAIM